MNAIVEMPAARSASVSARPSADAILQECVKALDAWDFHRATNYLREYLFRVNGNDCASAETETALADALQSFVDNATQEQLDFHAGGLEMFRAVAQQPLERQERAEQEAKRRKRDARIGWTVFLVCTLSIVASFVWSLFHRG